MLSIVILGAIVSDAVTLAPRHFSTKGLKVTSSIMTLPLCWLSWRRYTGCHCDICIRTELRNDWCHNADKQIDVKLSVVMLGGIVLYVAILKVVAPLSDFESAAEITCDCFRANTSDPNYGRHSNVWLSDFNEDCPTDGIKAV